MFCNKYRIHTQDGLFVVCYLLSLTVSEFKEFRIEAVKRTHTHNLTLQNAREMHTVWNWVICSDLSG